MSGFGYPVGAVDVTVLGFESTDKEGRRHFVGSLDVDSCRGRACGTLTEILGDSRLSEPLVVAENAEVAFHILDDEHIVGVVVIGGSGGRLRAHTGVNGDELVKLRLRGQLAPRLGGQLRLVGKNVDILPLRIGGERITTRQDCGSGTAQFITRQLRVAENERFCEEVYATLHAGQLGGALAPPERFLNRGTSFSHSGAGLDGYFNGLEAVLVDGLELNAEEHSGDVRQDKGGVFLYHDVLDVAHLVVAHEHIALGGDVHELRPGLVVEGAELQLAVGAFHGTLSVLGVVRYAAVGEQVAFVVLVHEVLQAVEIEVLGAEARVERKEDLLSDVNGIGRGNRVGELHVVAFLGCDGTCGDFFVGNRVEAVEQVGGGVTGGVALAVPDGIVQVLREVLGDAGEDVAGRGHSHLTVALCGAGTEKR